MPNIFLLIVAMIQMPLLSKQKSKAWRLLSHPKKTEKYRESTTGVFIASGIWLRTLFYTSSVGEASQLGMQKIQPLF